MRSSLNLTIGFGLASIPTGLAKLIDDDDSVEFRTVHRSCKTPLKEKKWCPKHGVEVPIEEQLKAYEVSKGHHIHFTLDEVSAAKPVSDGVVRLTKFVPEEQMPEPHMWLKHYILIPDEVLMDRYWSFLDALVGMGLVGVGQSVLWKKLRTCIVRPERFGKYLLLSTVTQAIPRVPDFGAPPYDDSLIELTTSLIGQMAGTMEVADVISHDPVRLLVEARQGVKRRRPAEVKVETVADYQASLKASMQTKRSRAASKRPAGTKATVK